MQKTIVVIDDDLVLVTELIGYLEKHFPRTPATGPPDLFLDLPDIREKSANAAAVIVDLKIGGSGTYGRSIINKMCKTWEKFDTPVIVWSKYLNDTILYESGVIIKLPEDAGLEKELSRTEFEELPDKVRIDDLRKVCGGIRAFVTKAVSDPTGLLIRVLQRLKLVDIEATRDEESHSPVR
ncbi:MAG: hypothetical protein AABO58_25360 [Acidobacteriota bacterium]